METVKHTKTLIHGANVSTTAQFIHTMQSTVVDNY